MSFKCIGLGAVFIALTLGSVGYAAPMARGPAAGTLIIAGGGKLGPEIVGRFIALAGGPDANIVVIPTAGGEARYGADCDCLKIFQALGARHLTMLHTIDRKEADTAAFVAPLTTATAVWFVGGRQWRLVDSYAGSRTQAEIEQLLARGGVVGGASIHVSYLVRGAREGNEVMMAPGYEQGFGLITGAAIDQHVNARYREGDLDAVVTKHPDLLGIGLDPSTAIEVKRDGFEVLVVGHVFIHDGKGKPNGAHYDLLSAGDRFNLKTLAKAP